MKTCSFATASVLIRRAPPGLALREILWFLSRTANDQPLHWRPPNLVWPDLVDRSPVKTTIIMVKPYGLPYVLRKELWKIFECERVPDHHDRWTGPVRHNREVLHLSRAFDATLEAVRQWLVAANGLQYEGRGHFHDLVRYTL